MNVVLFNIERQLDDPSRYKLAISFGDSLPVEYQASYELDSGARFCNIEPELFMELSDLAHKRFGDCTIYQTELMSIIAAFASGELNLTMPVQLGTTHDCRSKPTQLGILRNKLFCWLTMLKWRVGIGPPKLKADAKNHR